MEKKTQWNHPILKEFYVLHDVTFWEIATLKKISLTFLLTHFVIISVKLKKGVKYNRDSHFLTFFRVIPEVFDFLSFQQGFINFIRSDVRFKYIQNSLIDIITPISSRSNTSTSGLKQLKNIIKYSKTVWY